MKRFYGVDISGGDERIIIIERVQIYTCKMHSFIEIMIDQLGVLRFYLRENSQTIFIFSEMATKRELMVIRNYNEFETRITKSAR